MDEQDILALPRISSDKFWKENLNDIVNVVSKRGSLESFIWLLNKCDKKYSWVVPLLGACKHGNINIVKQIFKLSQENDLKICYIDKCFKHAFNGRHLDIVKLFNDRFHNIISDEVGMYWLIKKFTKSYEYDNDDDIECLIWLFSNFSIGKRVRDEFYLDKEYYGDYIRVHSLLNKLYPRYYFKTISTTEFTPDIYTSSEMIAIYKKKWKNIHRELLNKVE